MTIDDYMQTQGGYLRKTDLVEHRSNWVQPVGAITAAIRWGTPPNGQGIAATDAENAGARILSDGTTQQRRKSSRC